MLYYVLYRVSLSMYRRPCSLSETDVCVPGAEDKLVNGKESASEIKRLVRSATAATISRSQPQSKPTI